MKFSYAACLLCLATLVLSNVIIIEDFTVNGDVTTTVTDANVNAETNVGQYETTIPAYHPSLWRVRFNTNRIMAEVGSYIQTAYDAGNKVDVTITGNPVINRNVGSYWSPSWARFDYQFNTDGNFVNFVNPYGVNYPNGIDISAISSLFVGATATSSEITLYVQLLDVLYRARTLRLTFPAGQYSLVRYDFENLENPGSFDRTKVVAVLLEFVTQSDFQYHSAYFADAPIVSQTLPVTLDTAEDLSILQIDDQTFNINNEYDAGSNTPDIPTDACFAGAINPLWFHVAAVDARRTFTVSTCETDVDTVVGVYLADGTLLACNDDRASSTACDGDVDTCNTLSSSVEAVIDRNVEIFIVVAGLNPSATGAIDLRVQSQVEIEDLIEESTNSIIASLTQQLAALLANLTGQLTTLGESITTLGSTLTSAITTLSGSVDGQFSTLTTALGSVQTAVNGNIDDSTAALSGQISDLATALAATPDSLSGLTTTIGTISTNVNGLVTDTATLVGNVGSLQTTVQGVSADLGALSGSVGNLDADVAQVTADVGSLSTLVGALQTSLDNGIAGVTETLMILLLMFPVDLALFPPPSLL